MTRSKRDTLVRIAQAWGTNIYALARLLRAHGVEFQFAHDNALSLAATDVADLQWPEQAEARAVLVSTHLGLTGTTSPLPQETLTALQDAMASDHGGDLAALIGHLQHTLLALLHKGLASAQPSSSATVALTDPMSLQLLSATAHAEKLLPAADRMAAWAALCQPTCDSQHISWALGTVLRRHHLTTAVACRPLAGTVAALDPVAVWLLAQANSALGESCVLGDSAPAIAHRVAVTLGPVNDSWLQTCAFVADAVAHDIGAMLRATLPAHVGADVAVVLQRDAQVPWRLHSDQPRPQNFLGGLGAQTFLGEPSAPQTLFWPVHAAGMGRCSHG